MSEVVAVGGGKVRRPGRVDMRHFGWWLTLLTAGGLGLRIFVILTSRNEAVGGDGFTYWAEANQNDAGHWFVNQLSGKVDAIHPPAWTLLLTAWAALGHHGVFSTQLMSAVIGSVTVALVGLAGRRIAGDRAGLLAAGIAAVYAGLWLYERALLSETLLFPAIALMLILVYGFCDHPSMGRAALLGAMCGLMAMIRAEQFLIFPLLVVPLILTAKRVDWRARLAWLAIATALLVVVIAPWTIYNLGRFQNPVFLSTQAGGAATTGNCNGTYYGTYMGYYDLLCAPQPQPIDQSVADTKDLHAGFTYAEHHLLRLPLVEFAREGRAFGYWNPFQQTFLDNRWQHVSPIFGQGTTVWVYDLRLVSYWILVLPAIIGGVVLRRRRIPLYPLLAFVVTVVITIAVAYGETRYRAGAEVSIVLLAAVGIDALLPSKRRISPSDVASEIPEEQLSPRDDLEYTN